MEFCKIFLLISGVFKIRNLNLSQKKDNLKRFLIKLISVILTYLNFIVVISFLVPWIYGKIAINDLNDVITVVEVFVLSSATLALVTFTYISSMNNLDKDVKKSMINTGESFFMATIQFIAVLSLFLLVNLIIKQYLGPFNIILNFSWEGVISVFLLSIQLIAIYEVASALSKFLIAIFEVYKHFRIKKDNIILKSLSN